MAKLPTSSKHLQIDKANTVMIAAVAISSFIVVFSLVASKALLSQRAYQSRVITKKERARDQLKKNLTASDTLITAYKDFVGTSQNALGGNPNGTGDKDGDNAKIILDALPSKYDFPALATSLDKLLSQNGIKINSISGSDQELTQLTQKSSNNPASIEMPFTVDVSSDYGGIQNLIGVLEKSIRPIHVDNISFSGSDNNLNVTINAKTYYQPEKDLSINEEVVR